MISLAPDKDTVFAEAARVLRPAGRLAIADIVTEVALTKTNPYGFRSEQARGAGERFGVTSVSVPARRTTATQGDSGDA